MALKIALAGNPNCGKTTLFNDLTGSTQYVGNWPGVTVEKKEGRLIGHRDVIIQDLPGIYSLSPYTLEEVVSRNYLVNEKPDVILNIVDGTNIERNLYLTTQLVEIGIPVVIAFNMMDLVRKSGDQIDTKKLGKELGCETIEISALHSDNTKKAAELAIEQATKKKGELPHVFTGSVEHAIAHIEESIETLVPAEQLRWYAVKLFERDSKATEQLKLSADTKAHIEQHIADCEKEMDDDAESIITNQRYTCIQKLVADTVSKKHTSEQMTTSDKIDRIVTNRILALPIFAVIMWAVYFISVTTLGSWLTDWTNDVLFGTWITNGATAGLTALGASDAVISLLVDGIIGGVGTVLGFVPQMILLFLCLSILEDSGYMARVAFIMDRIFRRFGLSGKSFIPMLVGTGCGVPAIMASRTIENEKDRRMTILLSTFLPCGAKMEIVAMMTMVCFPGSMFVAPAMYFLGLGIVVFSGIALKKTKYFSGDPAPFVMELPAYHIPTVKGVLIHVWERAKAFMIKAGTIIFTMCIVIWFLMHFGPTGFLPDDIDASFLRYIGEGLSWIFKPLGFGTWQGAVASVSAEVAKEQATATLGMLAHAASDDETDVAAAINTMFGGSKLIGMSFLLFNIFDAPCMVAIATAFREQASRKWGWITFGYQMMVGYCLSLCVYQIGAWVSGSFTFGTVVAIALILAACYFVFRPNPYAKKRTEYRREAERA
ncbi:MAG: ferrous iron transport protein B [Lachnospiraceae bacterium]|jgi:ferrous iron transport protein B|nr:ferrous iron transport protein B [Lachnospiraceae bacterium]MCI1424984.1 ferrous iron transport protein B [Lachnospiraceae bacterium]MCI1453684.1 ferrous iron transport protein B [Lachnospiraceae bacterium]